MDKKEVMSPALKKLGELKIVYNQNAMTIIKKCYDWYSNNDVEEFHQRETINGGNVEISQLGFAKRLCADNANLCEIVEVNAGKEETKFEGVLDILKNNKFGSMYRKQLEEMSATGTVGAYIRLDNAELYDNGQVKGGTIKINYVGASSIIPIHVENDDIIECAFIGTSYKDSKKVSTLVIFRMNENNMYQADSYFFDEEKELIDLTSSIQLGDVKPFSIMRTAEVNNFDNMEGYGYPKLYNSIPYLKTLDLAYSILFGDLDKGQKLLFINELLAEMKKDGNGKAFLTAKQKELFILLGEKLPDEKDIIHEYNPEIRTESIKQVFQLCLSLLSTSFGYGSKKYTLENSEIKTATEYIGQRQDSMQELNKQRVESTSYITELVNAIIWFHNQFNKEGQKWSIDDEIMVEFDDSYITDKATELESWRQDALSFPDIIEFKIQYIMKRLNCEHDEAVKYLNVNDPDKDDEVED